MSKQRRSSGFTRNARSPILKGNYSHQDASRFVRVAEPVLRGVVELPH